MDTVNQALFSFIKSAPTAFHATATVAALLREKGFSELRENTAFDIRRGGRYFVTRNGSSLIAFCIPSEGFSGFMIGAAHGDSPAFKLRETPTLADGTYLRLSTEKYGGMILSTWMDRPLSVAGRVTLKSNNEILVKNLDLGEPFLIIPNLAIHMSRSAGENSALNPAVDLIPLAGTKNGAASIESRICTALGVESSEILATDLFLYNPADGMQIGDLITAPRLDDLQAAFGVLQGFLEAKQSTSCPVFALFDNEEVGSTTKQGAASTFLADTLTRVCDALGMAACDYRRALAGSMMVSADNAHAKHPNHPEYADKIDAPVPNGGIVIKQNANQRYTTDAVSAALFRMICQKAQVPTQSYSNRPDIPGGSTLGNIANTQVSLNTVDVGLAQLAMHSSYETAGAADTAYLIRAMQVFFESAIEMTADGYRLL